MFHFLEYPFSRGETHIRSPDPYAAPDFDAGFLKDGRDMAPLVWGYIKSRETARRMDAYAGEVQAMHPHFPYDSPARAHDLNLDDTNRYALPGNITAGIQHGSWSAPLPPADVPVGGAEAGGGAGPSSVVSSNRKERRKELEYSKEDIAAIEEWVKRHVETTWHCLGVSNNTCLRSFISFPQPSLSIFSLLTTDLRIFFPHRLAPWLLGRATASSSTASWTSGSTCTASRGSRWPT